MFTIYSLPSKTNNFTIEVGILKHLVNESSNNPRKESNDLLSMICMFVR
jgi:hypothetical protein